MENKKKFNITGKKLNIIGFLGIIPIILLIFNSNIGLCFSYPVCDTGAIGDVFWLIIVPIYLLVNMIIHLKENKNNKVKTFFKQLFLSILIFLEATVGFIVCGVVSSKCLCNFKSFDKKEAFLAEETVFLDNANFSIKKRYLLFFTKRITDEVSISGRFLKVEISWIDEKNYNIKLEDGSDSIYSTNATLSFRSPDKLELISNEEYDSQEYIKTEIYE